MFYLEIDTGTTPLWLELSREQRRDVIAQILTEVIDLIDEGADSGVLHDADDVRIGYYDLYAEVVGKKPEEPA